mmetsp:Transcript_13206/g.23732  ORF Transcript_13206/g.23732 Transcript_13206/m.23732 type:complete len:82 (-) Transcript_13206:34-279(-)
MIAQRAMGFQCVLKHPVLLISVHNLDQTSRGLVETCASIAGDETCVGWKQNRRFVRALFPNVFLCVTSTECVRVVDTCQHT